MNELIRMSLAMVVFSTIVLSLACGSGSQNANVTEDGFGKPPNPCSSSDVTTKMRDLDQRIRNDVKYQKGTKLQKQIMDGTFTFTLVPFSSRNLIELKLNGRFLGKGKGDTQTAMEDFFDIIDDFLKEGCIQKVTINEKTAGTGTATSGFEWQLCEHPDVYCDGVCQPSCGIPGTKPPADPTANSSSNSNNKSNSNVNANTSANANTTTSNGNY